MENSKFTVIIEKDEDGVLIASVPALKGCHTQAKTMEELYPRIKEAIELYLEVDSDPIQLDLVGVQEMEFARV